MNRNTIHLLSFLLFLVSFNACKKKEKPKETPTKTVSFTKIGLPKIIGGQKCYFMPDGRVLLIKDKEVFLSNADHSDFTCISTGFVIHGYCLDAIVKSNTQIIFTISGSFYLMNLSANTISKIIPPTGLQVNYLTKIGVSSVGDIYFNAQENTDKSLWVSTNSGSSWSKCNKPSGSTSINCFVKGNTIYAASLTDGKMYISTDKGSTWKYLFQHAGTNIECTIIDVSTTGKIAYFAFDNVMGNHTLNTYYNGIKENLTAKLTVPDPNFPITTMLFAPNGQEFLLGTSNLNFISNDNGTNHRPFSANAIFDGDCQGNNIVLTGPEWTLLSIDAGHNWRCIGNKAINISGEGILEALAKKYPLMRLQLQGTLYLNEKNEWISIPASTLGGFVAFDEWNMMAYYFSKKNEVEAMYSKDKGYTWTSSKQTFAQFTATVPNCEYLPAAFLRRDGELLVQLGYGDSWAPNSLLLSSTDSGKTFTEKTLASVSRAFMVSGEGVADSLYGYSIGNSSYMQSDDGGRSWTQWQQGFPLLGTTLSGNLVFIKNHGSSSLLNTLLEVSPDRSTLLFVQTTTAHFKWMCMTADGTMYACDGTDMFRSN